jgi:hypothetical protein
MTVMSKIFVYNVCILQCIKTCNGMLLPVQESASSVDTDEEAGGQVPGLKSDSDVSLTNFI